MFWQMILFIGAMEFYTVQSQSRNCTADEHDYSVSIIYGRDIICDGSHVAFSWVLTSAHCCITIRNSDKFSVIARQIMLDKNIEISSNIDKVVIHKHFSMYPLDADICLIKLKTESKIIENLQINKLPTTKVYMQMIKNHTCKATSQCSKLTILKKTMCQHAHPHYAGESVVCAVNKNGNESLISIGNSGGPVMCNGLQIGVVSVGVSCGNFTLPALFTRTDIYKEYINVVIGNTYQPELRSLRLDRNMITYRNTSGEPSNNLNSNAVGWSLLLLIVVHFLHFFQ